MSLEEKKLPNDIESYLRGEQPPSDKMDKAPRLEEWAPVIARGPAGGCCMTLSGTPFGHPQQPDGKALETSEIMWLDRKYRWARTRARLWRLGEAEGREIPVDGIDA